MVSETQPFKLSGAFEMEVIFLFERNMNEHISVRNQYLWHMRFMLWETNLQVN